jgi:DNA-binding LytR/AlgR family response regulator
MRVLLVDDEPLARARLARMLARIEGVTVVGEAGDAVEAEARIEALAPELVFLDIRMPGLDGLALAQTGRLPPVVFVTAHAEHALPAFDVPAVDYLLKPVSQERLLRAVERARARGAPPPRIRARTRQGVVLVSAEEITAFSARDKYSVFLHQGEELLLEESLSALEARLASQGFLRVHRAELVNLRHARALVVASGGLTLTLSDGRSLPVSRRMAAKVRRHLGEVE